MKTHPASLLFGLFLSLALRAELPEHPAHMDEALGLAFPSEFAGMRYQAIQEYSEHGDGLGYSLRYRGEGPQKLDVYLYDKELPEIPDGVDHDLIRKESRALISDLRYVEKMGQYRDLEVLATDEKVVAGEIPFLRNRFEYVQVQKPAFEGTLGSISLITGWGGSFVKVRYTYGLSEQEQGEKIAAALPGALAEVLHGGGPEVRAAVREPVFAAIEAFRKNPRDEEAQARIGQYAMNSTCVSVMITEKRLPWIMRDKSDTSMMLMMAYLAGNIEPQMRKDQNGDHAYEGALEVIRTYQQLKEKDETIAIPEVETWMTLEKEGKLKEAFSVEEPPE